MGANAFFCVFSVYLFEPSCGGCGMGYTGEVSGHSPHLPIMPLSIISECSISIHTNITIYLDPQSCRAYNEPNCTKYKLCKLIEKNVLRGT